MSIASSEKSPSNLKETTKAEAYFERALTVAYQQQAKSWELRAVVSMAPLFTAGLRRASTRSNLQEAKALLDALAL
jgi:hypothetical protein